MAETLLPEPDSPTTPSVLPGSTGVGYAINRLDDAALGGEEGMQIFCFKQCHILYSLLLIVELPSGSMASRRPSPIRLMQIVHRPKSPPGNTQRHQYC